MQKYQNNVTTNRGVAVARTLVRVENLDGTLATVYSDNGVTITSNPMLTNENGYFEFYADTGRYNILISGGEAYTDFQIADVVEAVEDADADAASAAASAAAAAATLAGAVKTVDLAAVNGAGLVGFERSAIAAAIPVDLRDWMDSTPLRDIECGVVGDNVADDTLALNVLTAAGRSAGCKVVGRVGATYKITDTVHINCNADFAGSIFATTTALATGAVKTSGTVAGSLLRLLDIRYPTIQTNKAAGAVPTVGSIGVQIEGSRDCRFDFGSVYGFEENLQLYSSDGTNGYVAYNALYFNRALFTGSKINIHLKTESTGWVNECAWFGGHFAQDSADAAAYTATNLQISKVDAGGNNPPNGHKFFGLSLEGNFNRTIKYDLNAGFVTSYFSVNCFFNCRFEAAVSMEYSALALYDKFYGCNGLNGVTFVGGVIPNMDSTRIWRHTTDVSGIQGAAGFRTDSRIPIFQTVNSGTAAAVAAGFNNRVNAAILGSGDISVYNPGNDTSLYAMGSLRVSGGLPRLEMGIGTAAPTTYITWNIDFRVQGNWNPNADVTYNLGSASLRYTNVYASNFRPGAGTATWTSGAGTPEGAVTAAVGSMFTRTDGGASTTLYIKESGAGNTGWIAK
jgi:hypothetical protein